ncbi:hypothetical protein CRYUN_Cryun06bG0100200 [Craigia yunnanensis]
MGTREVKSPEDLRETPASLDGMSDSVHRKKLGVFFIESDNRRTAFACGYTRGTTPVNIQGKPIADLSKTGGWIAVFFIFVDNFLGISQASSVLGGFLADAYLGRYWTIAIFTTIYLAGLTGITLCATMKIFVPNQDQCDQLSLVLGSCEPAKPWQMLYLYTVLYITALGAAVYIQIERGWGAAFGSLAIAMGISNMLFFAGTPLYRHRLPGGSPLTRVAQVLVASFKKRTVPFTRSDLVGLYELPGRQSAIKGSGKIPHTDDFRCLDKAALQLKEDGSNPSP